MKAWNIALWVAQVLLAAAFGYAGFYKATAPMPELVARLVWPASLPPELVRFIGGCEVAGALGMLLPAATRIMPILTPLAAAGLATIMLMASVFHLSRGEASALGITLPLAALAVFVAAGRLHKAPIPPR
jgi:hypothetical protein